MPFFRSFVVAMRRCALVWSPAVGSRVVCWRQASDRSVRRAARQSTEERATAGNPRTVGAPSYGPGMDTTQTAPPLTTEDYWARMQALRDQLQHLQQAPEEW